MLKNTVNGILAGLAIALGGSVFLACDSRYVGAFFFCVALLSICYFGFNLYTGKIGFLAVYHKKSDFALTYSGLLGNLIGCVAFGLLVRFGVPNIAETAASAVAAKLSQTVNQALIRAFFCGVLMYIAVWVYKEKKSVVGILFCIPVFILSGFEHSIADMFYFSAAASFDWNSLFYIILIVVGNSVGGLIIPLLQKLTADKKQEITFTTENKNEQN